MSWWSRAISWLGQEITLTDDPLYDLLATADTSTDERVTATSVLGLSAAWACVTLLSGTISTLSLDVTRRDGRLKRAVPEHALQSVLSEPNADQTDLDFWEEITLGLELWGNGYAKIDRHSGGGIMALTPIRPEFMRVDRGPSGALRYRWPENGRTQERDETGVFHIRGVGGNALGGLSPLSYARNTFGNAQVVERAAGQTFANGVRSSGAFMSQKDLTPDQMNLARRLIEEKYAGAMNAGRPLLLNGDMKWQAISINPEDAQMLESRGFSVEAICQIYGVPPFMIGHTEKVTSFGSGLEQQVLGFQKFTLRKRLKKIERAIRQQLMTANDRAAGYDVSFNLEDLLRGDSAARAEFYRKLLDAGVITINEVRALEGLTPIEGGDVPRMQMQNVPITDMIGHNGGPPLEEAA